MDITLVEINKHKNNISNLSTKLLNTFNINEGDSIKNRIEVEGDKDFSIKVGKITYDRPFGEANNINQPLLIIKCKGGSSIIIDDNKINQINLDKKINIEKENLKNLLLKIKVQIEQLLIYPNVDNNNNFDDDESSNTETENNSIFNNNINNNNENLNENDLFNELSKDEKNIRSG